MSDLMRTTVDDEVTRVYVVQRLEGSVWVDAGMHPDWSEVVRLRDRLRTWTTVRIIGRVEAFIE